MIDFKFSSIREFLHFRMTESEDRYIDEDYWNALVDFCLKHKHETIDFICNIATDEELYWFDLAILIA